MKRILVFLALLLPAFTYAQEPQPHSKLLTLSYSVVQLAGMLAKGQEWVTLPSYSDRAFWNGLPASIRGELIKAGEIVSVGNIGLNADPVAEAE